MPLASMTGFARVSGATERARWAWELRSVNAKGLDVRVRTPAGYDAVEQAARAEVAAKLKRGSIQATLTIERASTDTEVRINEPALNAVLAAAAEIAKRVPGSPPPSVDALLAQRGVVEIVERSESEDERAAFEAELVAGFAQAVEELAAARAGEGAALESVLRTRVGEIAGLTAQADASPARTPEAVRRKLEQQVATLIGGSLDPDRLHQEAVLLASRADIREELDRLNAHVDAALALIGEGGAVGRRLDFLAQEFGRESNTLCAKANDRSLTAIGLELKAVVEQFREQVQNVE